MSLVTKFLGREMGPVMTGHAPLVLVKELTAMLVLVAAPASLFGPQVSRRVGGGESFVIWQPGLVAFLAWDLRV